MDIHKILDRQKQTAAILLEQYDGKLPLHHHLKNVFSANKKYGSKDRKRLMALCYAYFRLGKNIPLLTKEPELLSREALLSIAGYISGIIADSGIPAIDKNPLQNATAAQRFMAVSKYYPELDINNIFDFREEFSTGIEAQAFKESFLSQPATFIRIRPGKHKRQRVLNCLTSAGVPYKLLSEHTVALPPGVAIQQILAINKDVIIQDISSQRMAYFLSLLLTDRTKSNPDQPYRKLKVWDCCAASGGKSILACDFFQSQGYKLSLTVSDIRESIIANLKNRFRVAGIQGYKKYILDLCAEAPLPFVNPFDLVICDAPCSGSGTWGRSPEQLLFFNGQKIIQYNDIQTRIAAKAWDAVAPGGYFLYTTCSVFKQENENVVNFITENSGMQLIESKAMTGYQQNGDSMFGALFTKRK